MTYPPRNYGIDFLRILSMICVTTLHILGHGGVLDNTLSFPSYSISWLLEIIALPAVNVYLLISGFVGYKDNNYPKLKNIISIYFTVLFYSVIVAFIMKIVFPAKISNFQVLKSLFPVLFDQYWFFTAYFVLFLFSPMIHSFVYYANNKTLLIFFITVLFISIPSLLTDPFTIRNGYSFVWFMFVYTIGSIIKKLDLPNKFSNRSFFFILVISIIVTWLIRITTQFISISIMGISIVKLGDVFISYCSPAILLSAISILCLFVKTNVGKKSSKIIKFFAPTAFSVYLIHDNYLFRNLIVKDLFIFVSRYNPIVIPLIVLFIALSIFLICSLIDHFRIILFKLLRIESLSNVIANIIKKLFYKIIAKTKIV